MERDLMWLFDEHVEINKNEFSTFLSVIGRKHDEDLISRVLVYIMKKDACFVNMLLQKYTGDEGIKDIDACEIGVYPEKSMGKGRADIFAVVRRGNDIVATITVENKIYSYEHDDQTQTYYDWVKRQKEYKKADINAFFYLRPSFNHSESVCTEYVNITYSDIKNCITKSDYIIDDFKKHIEYYLEGETMELSDRQIDIINNYSKLNGVIREAINIYASNKNEMVDEIIMQLKKKDIDNKLKFEKYTNATGISSVHFYKDVGYKEKEYYFYSEIRFDDEKLDDIRFRNVIKVYPRMSTKKDAEDFLKSDFVSVNEILGQYSIVGDYYAFQSEHTITSKEWCEDFVKDAVVKLSLLIEECDRLIKTFLDFIETQRTAE